MESEPWMPSPEELTTYINAMPKTLTNDALQAAQDRYDEKQRPERTPPSPNIAYCEELELGLLPCVYCGDTEPGFHYDKRGRISVECQKCGARSPGQQRINNGHPQYKAAFDAWNREYERVKAVERFLAAEDRISSSSWIYDSPEKKLFIERLSALKALFQKG